MYSIKVCLFVVRGILQLNLLLFPSLSLKMFHKSWNSFSLDITKLVRLKTKAKLSLPLLLFNTHFRINKYFWSMNHESWIVNVMASFNFLCIPFCHLLQLCWVKSRNVLWCKTNYKMFSQKIVLHSRLID